MMAKVKVSARDITIGPVTVSELEALMWAETLIEKGYRKISNAYCMIARIDRDDWLDVLAKARNCSVADFYNADDSGVSDRHRDHYVRTFSKDMHVVAPEIIRKIPTF